MNLPFHSALTAILLLSTLAIGPACAGTDRLSLELFCGAPLNHSSRLTVSQTGQPDLRFVARYETRPFERPLYYCLRAGLWREKSGWALDLVHHKLFLKNPPPEIQRFSITHGFNLLTLQRLWIVRGNVLSLGGGAVIAHPENEVRGGVLSEKGGWGGAGYYVAGPVLSLGAGRRQGLVGLLCLTAELRATLSYASVPVHAGDARLTHLAFHLMVGLAARF